MSDDAAPSAAPSAAGPGAAPPAALRGTGRAVALVTAGIVLSRFVGLVRQRVTAHYFGTSAVADAIAVAFRIGNTAQNLLGEGALSASFIPVYVRLRALGRDEEAARFARAALGALLVVAAVVSLVGVALAPYLARLVGAGFDPARLATTERLVRIVIPMTALLVLCAWGLGVLNAHGRFFLSYAAPVVWSGAQVAALLLVGGGLGWSGEPLAVALAWGALAGAALQLTAMLVPIRGTLGAIVPRLDPADPPLREAAGRYPAALLGRGVVQISGLVDTALVSFVGAGANAVFAYAQALYLLPMALLGTGEAAVALPRMARETAARDAARARDAVRAELGASFARLALLTAPCALVFVVFGPELVGLLLQTGGFDARSTAEVAAALALYGLALPGNVASRLLATACFAEGDTRTPARFALYRVLASTAVALALLRPLGVSGVVLGAAAAAWVETFALSRVARGRLGGLPLGQVPWGRLLAALAGGLVAGLLARGGAAALSMGTLAGSALVLGAFGGAFAALAVPLGLVDRARPPFTRRRGG